MSNIGKLHSNLESFGVHSNNCDIVDQLRNLDIVPEVVNTKDPTAEEMFMYI